MAKKKYLVFGGTVVTEKGKEKYIDAATVAKKYKVSTDDAILIDAQEGKDESELLQGRSYHDYINLRPSYEGHYDLDEITAGQQPA